VENLVLRHQIGVLQRSVKKRPESTSLDRFFWVSLSAFGAVGVRRWSSLSRKRLWPGIVGGCAGFGLGRFDRDSPGALSKRKHLLTVGTVNEFPDRPGTVLELDHRRMDKARTAARRGIQAHTPQVQAAPIARLK